MSDNVAVAVLPFDEAADLDAFRLLYWSEPAKRLIGGQPARLVAVRAEAVLARPRSRATSGKRILHSS